MGVMGYVRCSKGDGPNLRPYRLLAWTSERGVFTEDGAANIDSIYKLSDEGKSIGDIAASLGTTEAHVLEAFMARANRELWAR